MTRSVHLFEFGHYGHRPGFLLHLAAAWPNWRAGSELRITITPRFVEAHSQASREIAATAGVFVDVLSAAVDRELRSLAWPATAPMSWVLGAGPPAGTLPHTQWVIAMDRSAALGSDEAVFMELDLVLPAIAAQLPAPVGISGIWLKPAFYQAPPGARSTFESHEKLILARCLAHPRLHRILLMDTKAHGRLAAASSRNVFKPLTHILPRERDSASRARTRARLNIPDAAVTLLFFGEIAQRKGFLPTIAALRQLQAPIRERLFVIVAGKRQDIEATTLAACEQEVVSMGIRSHFREAYISDEEVDALFDAADVVLTPYIDHIGTSDVVVRAALHGVPVVAQESGLVGSLVRENRLGFAVEARTPADIARAIADCVTGAFDERFDAVAARAFARHQGEPSFAASFFRGLGFDEP